MSNAYARIAFTPSVRAEQARKGSARLYDRALSDDRDDGASLGPRESSFIEARDGIFQSTVTEDGWPYVQFRGGAPGFMHVLDPQTIAYADYTGNQQYISVGNLHGNDRVSIIAIDFVRAKRLKLFGRATLSEDSKLVARLNGDGPIAERAVIIRIAGYDWNCPQHIPRRLTDAEHQALAETAR